MCCSGILRLEKVSPTKRVVCFFIALSMENVLKMPADSNV